MEPLISMRPAAVIELDGTFFLRLAVPLAVLAARRFLFLKPMLALLEAGPSAPECKGRTAYNGDLELKEARSWGTNRPTIVADPCEEL